MYQLLSQVASEIGVDVSVVEGVARANRDDLAVHETFGRGLEIGEWQVDQLKAMVRGKPFVRPVTQDDMLRLNENIALHEGWTTEEQRRLEAEEAHAEWLAENAYVRAQEDRWDPEAQADLDRHNEMFPHGYCSPEEAARRIAEEVGDEEARWYMDSLAEGR